MLNVDRALDALGDPTRRLVFKRLRNGSCAVGELAKRMDVSRPAVSQHLKVLKEAGLVVVHVKGTKRLYEIDATAISALRSWLDELWENSLNAFKRAAEQEAAKRRNVK
jgi:DNA-binding transcriptional ArsR family regulator